MGYLMLTSTQQRTLQNRHLITLRQSKVVHNHNFEMQARLANLRHNRHRHKGKHRNNFIVSRPGLFLDEPLLFISSGREVKSYIEITWLPTKLFRFLQKNKRVFVFVGGLRFSRVSSFF